MVLKNNVLGYIKYINMYRFLINEQVRFKFS